MTYTSLKAFTSFFYLFAALVGYSFALSAIFSVAFFAASLHGRSSLWLYLSSYSCVFSFYAFVRFVGHLTPAEVRLNP